MKTPEIIKICGLSTVDSVEAVIDGGATHLGMIFFSKSPRHVTLEQAAILSRHAGNRIIKVAVTVDADEAMLDAIVANAKPDMLQLHGSETPEQVAETKNQSSLPVIKVFSVRGVEDLELAKSYIGVADHIMFDAKAPKGSELPGGNGVAFDWSVMDHWPEDVPYILSGGLNTDNIEEAIRHTGAYGIDISSGVEAALGIKDNALIREFLQTVLKPSEASIEQAS